MTTVSKATPYTVTSGNGVSGATPYTITEAVSYPFQKRVGTALLPVQFGRRRGTVIDWLSPDLP